MATQKYARLRGDSVCSNCSDKSFIELQIEDQSFETTEELTERTNKTPKGYWLAITLGFVAAGIFTINNGIIKPMS